MVECETRREAVRLLDEWRPPGILRRDAVRKWLATVAVDERTQCVTLKTKLDVDRSERSARCAKECKKEEGECLAEEEAVAAIRRRRKKEEEETKKQKAAAKRFLEEEEKKRRRDKQRQQAQRVAEEAAAEEEEKKEEAARKASRIRKETEKKKKEKEEEEEDEEETKTKTKTKKEEGGIQKNGEVWFVNLHVESLDRAHAVERFNKYILSEKMGEGSFGSVSAGCRITPTESCDMCKRNKQYCPYAIKVVRVDADKGNRWSALQRAGAERDIFYLQKFADLKVDGEYVVPRFYDAWMERDPVVMVVAAATPTKAAVETRYYPYYIVMERFDGDMEHLSARRFKQRGRPDLSSDPLNRPSVIFYEAELRRMFRIAALLGKSDGDLKPDQFLFESSSSTPLLSTKKGDGGGGGGMEPQVKRLVLTDFGFVGDNTTMPAYLGWPANGSAENEQLGCPNSRADIERGDLYVRLRGDSAHVNVVVLEMAVLLFHETLVVDPVLHTPVLFGGIRGLDRNFYAPNVCRRYTNELVKKHVRDSELRGNYQSVLTLEFSKLVDRKSTSTSGMRSDDDDDEKKKGEPPEEEEEEEKEEKEKGSRPYGSFDLKAEERELLVVWDRVLHIFRTQLNLGEKGRAYRKLALLVHPDKWSDDKRPDYASILRSSPDLQKLRPSLDTFWTLLTRRSSSSSSSSTRGWSPEKLDTFLTFIFKRLSAVRNKEPLVLL